MWNLPSSAVCNYGLWLPRVGYTANIDSPDILLGTPVHLHVHAIIQAANHLAVMYVAHKIMYKAETDRNCHLVLSVASDSCSLLIRCGLLLL